MTARDRIVLVVIVCLAAVAGSWLLVISPKRDQASKLGAQVKAAQTQLDNARSQVAAGLAARRSFAGYYTELARLGEAVPADDNVPSLIYQLQNAASAARVDFRSLQLTSGPSAPVASTPASANQATTATLPPGVSVGAAGLPTEPFSFTFQGNFFHLADFFGRLQRFVVATNDRVAVSGRLMSLNSITLGAGSRGFPQITATISATTYLVPSSQGILNGASPSGPAAPSTSQSASTSTGSAPAAATVSSPVR